MLQEYIAAAMRRATCEYLENDQIFYCEVSELDGVWSAGATEQECLNELADVIEGWADLGQRHGHRIPVLDDIDLNAARTA